MLPAASGLSNKLPLVLLVFLLVFCRSLIKSKIMPALVESEEEEEVDTESKDPLPEKLQNSMVTRAD